MKIYISGGMTGHYALQGKEFFRWHLYFEFMGWEVVNPAEIDLEWMRIHHQDRTWEACLREDKKLVKGCDAIFMMPGWDQSRGACVELHTAVNSGVGVIFPCELDLDLSPSSAYVRSLMVQAKEIAKNGYMCSLFYSGALANKAWHV